MSRADSLRRTTAGSSRLSFLFLPVLLWPMPTLADIAHLLNLHPPAGAANISITGVAVLSEAKETELSYLGQERFLPDFAATKAAAVIVQKRVKLPPVNHTPVLVVDDADIAVGRVLELFAPSVPRPPAGVDHAARVAKTAQVGAQVAIGPNVFIGQRARIGARTVLHAHGYVGDDTTLGDDCELFANVVGGDGRRGAGGDGAGIAGFAAPADAERASRTQTAAGPDRASSQAAGRDRAA